MARLVGKNEVAGMSLRFPFSHHNLNGYALYGHNFPEFDTVTVRDCRINGFAVVLGGNTRAFVYDNEFFHQRARGVRAHSTYAWIHDNLFVGETTSAEEGLLVSDAGTVLIERNVFDNTRPGGGRPHAAIYVNFVNSVTIRNNLIRQVKHPILWYYASGVVENNTIIDGDRGALLSTVLQRYFETLSMCNNLFLNNRAAFQFGLSCDGCDSTGWITYAYNAFWLPVDSFYYIYPGDPPERIKIFPYENTNLYPMLTTDSLFQLQYSSPLIDAGDPSILDADGSRSDIGWTGGPQGYTYSYPDLAPLAPESLRTVGQNVVAHVQWSARPETDLAGYRIYRGESPGFWDETTLPLKEVAAADTAIWDTNQATPEVVYYVVTAFDSAGQESGPSAVIAYDTDPHPPVWELVPDQEVVAGDTLTLSVMATDADDDPLTLSILDPPAHATFTDLRSGQGSLVFSPDESQVGEVTILLVASDGAFEDTLIIRIQIGPRVRPRTIHVSPLGSNTPPYATYQTAAHRVIDAARLATSVGDTILIHAGYYGIDSTILIAPGVSLHGVGRDSVTLDWTGPYEFPEQIIEIRGSLDHAVSGLEFRFSRGSTVMHINGVFGYYAGTISVSECRFVECNASFGSSGTSHIHDNEFIHGAGDGIICGNGHSWIHDNTFAGGFSGRGISVYRAGTILIEHNVSDNTLLGDARPRAGIEVGFANQVTIRNNLIRQAQHPVIWYYATGSLENNTFIDCDHGPQRSEVLQRYFETITIRNNIFLDSPALFRFGLSCDGCDSTGWITYAYNAFWPPVDSFYYIYPGDPPERIKIFPYENTNLYPMLTTDSLFQLQYGSPLIDAGDPSVLDVDGSRSDIGWTGGPGGNTYHYTDFPPLAPGSISVTGAGPAVTVCWSRRYEGDLREYKVSRGTHSGFWPMDVEQQETVPFDDTCWTDILPPDRDSAFYVVVAADSMGNTSNPSPEGQYVVADHPANRAPVLEPTGGRTITLGDSLELEVRASDPDDDSIVLRLGDSLDNAVLVDHGDGVATFSFAPDEEQVGYHSVRFIAEDTSLADTEIVEIEVKAMPSVPRSSRIVAVFPNPVRSLATIRVDIGVIGSEQAIPVELIVHDIHGRTVARAYRGVLSGGTHDVVWSAADVEELASGIYLLRLVVNGQTKGTPYKIAVIN
ncbi:MAG TPA: right-handed parallel beta-helix repeat-containing protein [candidate division Zixibacteria bacterium]